MTSTLNTSEFLRDLPSHSQVIATGLFRLGGSRYMNYRFPEIIEVNESTDWDFYCDASDGEALEWLKSNSVATVTFDQARYPMDDLALELYSVNDFQVIVRSDAEKYSKVIERLDPEFYKKFLWKSGPARPSRDSIRAIFNQLFKMV